MIDCHGNISFIEVRRINTPKSKKEPSVDLNFTENKQIWKEEYFLDSPDSYAGQS